jgi:carboxyl-terminal processing protease
MEIWSSLTLKIKNHSETDEIIWSSNKTAIATVNEDTGRVYARKVGSVTITAKVMNEGGTAKSYKCVVTVVDSNKPTVTPKPTATPVPTAKPTPTVRPTPDASLVPLSDEDFYVKRYNIDYLIANFFLWDYSEAELQEAQLRALVNALNDPYSVYYTKQESTANDESTAGEYFGIGVMVSQDPTTKVITIVKVFKDGPAYRAGVLVGDIVSKVAGEDISGLDVNKVVAKIKGEKGTKIKLSFIRPSDDNKTVTFTIKREAIEVPTVEYEMLADKIGYIYVLEFDQVTNGQFRIAIDALMKQGMKGLVVDVRDNPGGLVNVVCDMLDRLLPEGVLLTMKDGAGNVTATYSSDAKESFKLPLAVLVNGNSASASEIFAGAIQDYGTGMIVGDQSFGKGIVQSIWPLGDGSSVKLTTAQYFTPKGRNIHGIGITPDIKVALDESLKTLPVVPKDKDNQLAAAIKAVKAKIK